MLSEAVHVRVFSANSRSLLQVVRPAVAALGVLLVPAAGRAVTMPGFDHAIPLEPQKLEAGGGVAGGDQLISAFALARLGLLDDLDFALRVGFIGGLKLGTREDNGFEVQAAPRFRFIRTEDTGFVDAAVVADVSIVKTEGIFVLGLDPTVVASHHFAIEGRRQLYIALGLGVAFDYYDADGGPSDLESGIMGSASAGVDVVEHLRLSLEARLRDEFERYGLAVTYQF